MLHFKNQAGLLRILTGIEMGKSTVSCWGENEAVLSFFWGKKEKTSLRFMKDKIKPRFSCRRRVVKETSCFRVF